MKTCELCKKHDSQIEISIYLNEKLVKLHVCGSCAAECKLDMEALENGTVPEFIEHCLALHDSHEKEPVSDLKCPDCGLTREEFEETGQLGCPFCYHIFRDHLVEFLPGEESVPLPAHCGKEQTEMPRESILSLQKRLKEVVAKEEYEEAAVLRDRILALQDELGQDPN